MYRARLNTAWPCTPLKDPYSWHGQLQLPGWLQGLSARLPWQDSLAMAPGRAVRALCGDVAQNLGDTLIAPRAAVIRPLTS